MPAHRYFEPFFPSDEKGFFFVQIKKTSSSFTFHLPMSRGFFTHAYVYVYTMLPWEAIFWVEQ